MAAFLQGLQQWAGRSAATCEIDTRWAHGNADALRKHAAELVALAPDVILAALAARPWRRCCRRPAPCRSCSPVVIDPVGAGFVDSLARPGGNATGFTQFEYGMSGEMAGAAQADRAGMTRAAVLARSRQSPAAGTVRRHPGGGAVAGRGGQPRSNVRDAGEIERAVDGIRARRRMAA